MAEGDRRITCPVCGKTHSSISGGYCPYCEKVTSDDPVVMPKKKPYDQVVEEQRGKARSDTKQGEKNSSRLTSDGSLDSLPVAPTHTVQGEPYNPNTSSIICFIFAWILPIVGYPFGVIGKERALRTGDVTGRKLANAGMVISVICYIAYCALGIVFAWIDGWVTGLIVSLVLFVFTAVYFPLCDRLKKDK